MSTSDTAVLALYETEPGRKAVRASALAEYRCAGHGCMLFHVWQSPQGVMFYRPAYKLSAGINAAESSAEGRAVNTNDGDNHWKATAGTLESARGWDGHRTPLQCDHARLNVETVKILDDAESATPGKPQRRRLPQDNW